MTDAERIAELEAKLAEIRAAYRTRYDCADEDDPANLMRWALESEAAEHVRFKARGGEIDALEAKVAEAQVERAKERLEWDRVVMDGRTKLAAAESHEKALRKALVQIRDEIASPGHGSAHKIGGIARAALAASKEPTR